MTHDKIDWKRMCFKQNKVWMAIDQKQRPVVKNGKVLIKYQLDQDYEYWILQKNIKPVDALPSEITSSHKRKLNKKSLKHPETKLDSETRILGQARPQGCHLHLYRRRIFRKSRPVRNRRIFAF